MKSLIDFWLHFPEKERKHEMIVNERASIEEQIKKLSKDIEDEEADNQKKKDMFVEDLDKQVEEKRQPRKDRATMFRQTNELSDKLTKLYMNKEEPGISVRISIIGHACKGSLLLTFVLISFFF